MQKMRWEMSAACGGKMHSTRVPTDVNQAMDLPMACQAGPEGAL